MKINEQYKTSLSDSFKSFKCHHFSSYRIMNEKDYLSSIVKNIKKELKNNETDMECINRMLKNLYSVYNDNFRKYIIETVKNDFNKRQIIKKNRENEAVIANFDREIIPENEAEDILKNKICKKIQINPGLLYIKFNKTKITVYKRLGCLEKNSLHIKRESYFNFYYFKTPLAIFKISTPYTEMNVKTNDPYYIWKYYKDEIEKLDIPVSC